MTTKKQPFHAIAPLPTWLQEYLASIAAADKKALRAKTQSIEDNLTLTASSQKVTASGKPSKGSSGQLLNGTEGADSLVGGSYGDTLNGANGNDTLRGGGGTDQLNGGLGDDLLDGGSGSDILKGGAGNDRYIVDTNRDSISELAGEGIDTVESSVSWTLGSNLERLILVGTANLTGNGNTLDNHLTGNAGSNLLQGGAGNDTLDGGINAASMIDTLSGGTGDDLYIVRSASDVVRENFGEGTDTVQASVNHTLAANVEHLMLAGTSNLTGGGNDLGNRITGNDGANLLQGHGGNDTLLGGSGADTLEGGAGNDVLQGDAGVDVFRFTKSGGKDTIADFSAAQGDLIDLTGTGITGLSQLQITNSGSSHVIGLGDGTTVTLTSTEAPQESWFKFDPPTGGGGEPPPPSGGAAGQIFNWEGISLPSYWGGNFQTSGGLTAMDQVKATGANTITLVPNFFMTDQYSNEVKLNVNTTNPWASESDTFAQVKQAILDSAARGLKVVVKPHVETDNRVWRALIEPTNPDLWFENYKNMMVEYAKVAQEAGAAMFVIGTEMKSMTNPNKVTASGKTYTQKWGEIIDAVKVVYSGPLTYSATDSEAAQVQFWDKLDYIGANAYFPMTTSNNPTVAQLVDAWTKPSSIDYTNQIHKGLSAVDYYKSLSEQWGKKVIFTEVGYQSIDGANKDPGLYTSGTVDYQEQKDAYEALYHVMENYGGRWLDGAFLWSYQTSTTFSSYATDYTTQGKIANDVITAGYSSPAHVTGLTWNGTETANKLDGGYHNDTLNGNGGNDILWGGAGHDALRGGTGGDRFEFGAASGNDTIHDFEVAVAGEVIAITKNVNGLALTTFEQLLARATTVGADTVINLGGGHSIKLAGISKSQLSTDDFQFV